VIAGRPSIAARGHDPYCSYFPEKECDVKIESVASFTATSLKTPGPALDAAARGPVRITRRGETFVLLREAQLAEILTEAADLRPKDLTDLVAGYDPAAVASRLGGWLTDRPAGKEPL
jgi:hypothetical protein